MDSVKEKAGEAWDAAKEKVGELEDRGEHRDEEGTRSGGDVA